MSFAWCEPCDCYCAKCPDRVWTRVTFEAGKLIPWLGRWCCPQAKDLRWKGVLWRRVQVRELALPPAHEIAAAVESRRTSKEVLEDTKSWQWPEMPAKLESFKSGELGKAVQNRVRNNQVFMSKMMLLPTHSTSVSTSPPSSAEFSFP